VTLKTTLEELNPSQGDTVTWARMSDVFHDARRAHELLAAYTAALTALEASDRDRQKLRARIKELEAELAKAKTDR
jgi:cell division protein FtsB